jgi:hypothetical protein
MRELHLRLAATERALLNNANIVVENGLLKISLGVLYFILNVVVLIVLAIGILFMVILPSFFYNANNDVFTFINWYFSVTGIIFIFLAGLLVTMYCQLEQRLRKFEAFSMNQQ